MHVNHKDHQCLTAVSDEAGTHEMKGEDLSTDILMINKLNKNRKTGNKEQELENTQIFNNL